ncbi:MAG: RNA-binding protein [Chloroflexi bacterium]|nr:RNA-binding protein [Chloroflexota bacterium]
MTARLYVGNLPYSATEEVLRRLFSQVGTVASVTLPMDRATGRPRGFGFVEMESADAEEAVRKFDGYQLDNRSIRVQIAKEREARAPGFRPSGRRYGTEYGIGRRREGRGAEGRRRRGRAA